MTTATAREVLLRPSRIANLIARLDTWLTAPPVLDHGGAVAGVVLGRRALYWYPEIAGYYLSYLADRGQVAPARRVVDWLTGLWGDHALPTRIYPEAAAASDWRNTSRFSFDLAMVLRGLGLSDSVAGARELREIVADWICAHMVDASGDLQALWLTGEDASPATWSTRPGAFQLKTLAAIALSGASGVDPAWVRREKARILASYPPDTWDSLPLHPRLYACEGLLALGVDEHSCQIVHGILDQVLRHHDPDHDRIDVQAQLLRLLLLLVPEHPSIPQVMAGLIGALEGGDGAPFRSADQDRSVRNVWCTLFARQALQYSLAPPGSNRWRFLI